MTPEPAPPVPPRGVRPTEMLTTAGPTTSTTEMTALEYASRASASASLPCPEPRRVFPAAMCTSALEMHGGFRPVPGGCLIPQHLDGDLALARSVELREDDRLETAERQLTVVHGDGDVATEESGAQ